MRGWFDWLFTPKEDMPTTFMIAFNFLVIEAIIKVVYDLTLGICLRLLDRVSNSTLNAKVRQRVFDGIQKFLIILSILCFCAELFAVVYYTGTYLGW